MSIRNPVGAKDILPPQAEIADPEEKWRNTALFHRLEEAARASFARFGYEEIRPPMFEQTALFHKSSGETTDIVEKEMFTFGGWADLDRRLHEAYFGKTPEGAASQSPIKAENWQVTVARVRSLLQLLGSKGGAAAEDALKQLRGEKEIILPTPDQEHRVLEVFRDFLSGDQESLSLRPELTPGVIRALIQENLFAKRSLWKVWYFGPAFRNERTQKGRFKQFTQLGVEAVGSFDPLVDAETMILLAEILESVGVASKLRINSIGCGDCRGGYREILKAAVRPLLPTLCENCNRRIDRNVFRILDCKVDAEKTKNLPAAIDHTCDKCKAHLKAVEGALRDAKVEYRIDPRIVRGLDYYTRTVYEFTSSALGAQNAIAGGGRYDTLVHDMGGPPVGAVGFAAGAERILLAMKDAGAPRTMDFFGVAVDESLRGRVFSAVTELRRAGLRGDMDFEGRSLKAQMRSANRSGARYALLIGPAEAAQNQVKLKDMKEGAERLLSIDEAKAALRGGTT